MYTKFKNRFFFSESVTSIRNWSSVLCDCFQSLTKTEQEMKGLCHHHHHYHRVGGSLRGQQTKARGAIS